MFHFLETYNCCYYARARSAAELYQLFGHVIGLGGAGSGS